MAASVWSLLLPALEQSASLGKISFFPAAAGFWLGIFFLARLHKRLPCVYISPEEIKKGKKEQKLRLLIMAIVIHNIPEGMAVGAVYADRLLAHTDSLIMGALVLSLGIAIQNIPEGAIISLPLCANGMERKKACFYGILSGVVEPVFGAVTICLSGVMIPAMPYLLGFSAGAMIYVVIEELVPESQTNEKKDLMALFTLLGFSIMMILDVALG